jgi:hypothetical protein
MGRMRTREGAGVDRAPAVRPDWTEYSGLWRLVLRLLEWRVESGEWRESRESRGVRHCLPAGRAAEAIERQAQEDVMAA